MTETAALVRLLTWLSPAFPIGGFAYSQGLETAIAAQRITTIGDVRAWLEGQLHAGPVRNDAAFVGIAARALVNDDVDAVRAANALALALQSSVERDKETREQARSFLDAASAWPVDVPARLAETLAAPMALPVAVGAMAGLHRIDAASAIAGFVNAYAGQQISVAIRLVPLGQTEGVTLQAALESKIAALADWALGAQISDIGSLAYGTDIASLKHEDLPVRIFRS
ncbi:urease accessory protein UreF [Pelagibacterium xiamenense]|uniref:urease accessory protein UreF n=1 Tax=Pelagibacterium xiamenense TaxID=2901140 RepID=UPI001E3BBD14|nr:urease accessory UreF family protein [Pelagibacterium xiamenense]MCD7058710.1 urease accessory protein UreF [Pelagibacterium xiamenense]